MRQPKIIKGGRNKFCKISITRDSEKNKMFLLNVFEKSCTIKGGILWSNKINRAEL
jgi:hypothetical protein